MAKGMLRISRIVQNKKHNGYAEEFVDEYKAEYKVNAKDFEQNTVKHKGNAKGFEGKMPNKIHRKL